MVLGETVRMNYTVNRRHEAVISLGETGCHTDKVNLTSLPTSQLCFTHSITTEVHLLS